MSNARELAELAGSYGTGGFVGMKNRIINGAMMIDQRNAGASVSSGLGVVTYTLDRWFIYVTGAALQVQRVAGTTIPYMLQVTGAASNTVMTVCQRIESNNIADLAGQTVTVSFVAASSSLSSISWAATYCNSVDNFSGGVTAIATGSQAITSTETRYSFNVTLPTNAKNGVEIYFTTNGLTSGTFKIGQVQLEKGSTATSFDYRPYGTELALCQRYCVVYGGSAIYERFGMLQCISASAASTAFSLPVEMRASPAIEINSVGNFAVYSRGAITTCTGVNLSFRSPKVLTLEPVVIGGLTTGSAGDFIANNTTSARLTVTAEL